MTEEGIRRLERELKATRRNGARALRQLHRTMSQELQRATKRAENAEHKLKMAEQEARQAGRKASQAEAELERIRSSRVWKAGKAVSAVPSAIKQRGRK